MAYATPKKDLADPIFRAVAFSAATMLLITLSGLIISLIIGGWPALSKFGFSFLTSTTWNPVTEVFGAAGPITGTLITAVLSLAIALPIAIFIAVFLTQFCPKVIAQPISTAIELLAG